MDDVAAVMENSKTAFIEEYVSDEQGRFTKESTVDIYYQLLSGKGNLGRTFPGRKECD